MKRFGDFIVKKKKIILLITLVLLIPSLIGYLKTKINYDILTYLPSDIETFKVDTILTDHFASYAFQVIIH